MCPAGWADISTAPPAIWLKLQIPSQWKARTLPAPGPGRCVCSGAREEEREGGEGEGERLTESGRERGGGGAGRAEGRGLGGACRRKGRGDSATCVVTSGSAAVRMLSGRWPRGRCGTFPPHPPTPSTGRGVATVVGRGPRLQRYMNGEIPYVQARFRKSRGTRGQIANIHWIIEKPREFQKNIYLSNASSWGQPKSLQDF